ncbi:MAG: PAS domain S-box protein [Verrucomicrobia bacterium]|nr:PAS domain S-box protein [Verrucomicrobiota bacterium]
MLRHFHIGSIRRKLMAAILLTSAAAVLVMATVMIAYERVQLRREVKDTLITEAELIARSVANSLAAGDVATARERLSALWVQRETVQACLHTPDGKLFVEYDPADAFSAVMPATGEVEFGPRYALLRWPVLRHNQLVGYVSLREDMQPRLRQLRLHFLIALAAIAGALVVAAALSLQLQRIISTPLRTLTRAARAVVKENDYGIRVVKRSRDETGELTDAFNQMLDEIARREAALAASEQRYRLLADTVPDLVCVYDLPARRNRYINRAVQRILGVTPEQFQNETLGHFVHPDDKPRLEAHHAALSAARDGEVLETICRFHDAEGRCHWLQLRDTIFTRDADGRVQQIIGAASDITALRDLQREVLEISERERARIGRDIHDSLCQQLVGVTLMLRLLRDKLQSRNPSEAVDAAEMERLLREAVHHAREISHNLHPAQFLDEGLCVALQNLADQTSQRCSVQCVAACQDGIKEVDRATALHLYRIVQEAVANAVKHAQSRRIDVRLSADAGVLRLTVQDDGCGFADTAGNGDGLGLRIMRYRARQIGGKLSVRSAEGSGTVVTCQWPVSGL